MLGILLVAMLPAACSDVDEVLITTCSSVVAAINVDAAAIEIRSTAVDSGENTARITFAVERDGRIGRVEWVECLFADLEFPQLVPELIGVDTSDGPLGEGRLFVLKRWWLNDDPDSWATESL